MGPAAGGTRRPSPRPVAVSGETAGLLFQLRDQGTYVLAGRNRDLYTEKVRRQLRAVCCAAGLPEVLPHGLRRTAPTLMARAGIPIDTAQEILGHRRYQTTQEHYLFIEEEGAARLKLKDIQQRAPPD